jgi:glycerol-3-phosphate acyltransferase PlsX
MQIALDAMGGDHAPEPIVTGAIQAAQADPELRILLVGDQNLIAPLLSGSNGVANRIEIFHCTQAIGMDESPMVALRKKPDNSISRCWELLAQRKVGAIVSAGNTGAMVAGGFRLKLFLKNVRRPGIAAVLPTLTGPCVLLDVGANVNPKPEHLFQYGVMGSIFAKHVLRIDNPRIGLMNIGSEEAKGHDLAKETHALFNSSHIKPQFIGNVEGRDITRGVCDVYVTDGFVGNVVLKVCEGMFEFTMKLTARELQQKLVTEKELALKTMEQLVQRYDHHEQGGAPLLGIDGICIICHGSSGDRAIKNALGMASRYVKARLNSLIVQELEDMPALTGAEGGGA